MKEFYDGWDTDTYGTSEDQPGIYGDRPIPGKHTHSIPSLFSIPVPVEELAEDYVVVPYSGTEDPKDYSPTKVTMPTGLIAEIIP